MLSAGRSLNCGKIRLGCCTTTDIFLFPKVKTTLKGRRFQITQKIQENAIRELRAITESAFRESFQQWKQRWERCIASRGECFEGDSA
jgi:hypothetical protein